MAVPVDRKRSQPRVRRLVFPSLLGDGMPDRLRSTSIALIGTVAAVGLGTVAFALHLGLPAVVSGPLPEPPPKRHAVAERHRVEEKAAGDPTAEAVGSRSAASVGAERGAPPRDSSPAVPAVSQPSESTVRVTGPPPTRSRPQRPTAPRPAAVHSPTVETAPVAPPPVAPPPVEPAASVSEVPPPTAEAAPETPAPTHPGKGNAYGKGNGNGVGNGGEPPGQAAKAARQNEADE